MVYNSFNFLILYPLLFLSYYAIPASLLKTRNVYLLLISYILYILWEPIYAFILLGVTGITYYSALLLERTKHRRIVIMVGILLSLMPLLFFKYFNFINDSISEFLGMMGMNVHLVGLNWAIPVGISFYTFQAMGYLWDVYYKKCYAEHDFLSYALFISFFPSILSGPINKASLVIPQLRKMRPYFVYSKSVEGLKMILWGMFMKVVVADRVALYVDTVYSHYMNYSGLSCFVASILYTVQIYADFAGYSLMAIGVGKTLGFELAENFRRPYFAYSVTDFWRRWHISLSTWLKDYVYIPMGGSRCNKARNYWNIFVTFLISGIWHGANWTFVVWGIWHGFFQIVEKMLGQQKCDYGIIGKSIKIFVTFWLVNFAWIFFRMPTIADAIGVIKRIFDITLPMSLYLPPSNTMTLCIIIGVLTLLFKDISDEFFLSRKWGFNHPLICVRWANYIIVVLMIMLIGVFGADQFIYANF